MINKNHKKLNLFQSVLTINFAGIYFTPATVTSIAIKSWGGGDVSGVEQRK